MISEKTQVSDLLHGLASGQSGALSHLHLLLRPIVAKRVSGILYADHLVDEVVNVTLFRLWKYADRFDETKGHGIGWIGRIAHNAAIDIQRRESRMARNNQIMAIDALEADPAEPIDVFLEQSDTIRILDALTDEQREALILKYYADLTHDQIATYLDVPVGTTKSRIRRGLKAARDAAIEVNA